jgi:threonine dehydrogenase-like Zn-dependent dehydrogenase
VVIEATGAGPVVLDVLTATGPYGIVCLTGVSSGGHTLHVDAGKVNREVVLENDAVVGSVNANRRHYRQAADALAAADADWLHRLITREVPLADVAGALDRRVGDVKTVVRLTS